MGFPYRKPTVTGRPARRPIGAPGLRAGPDVTVDVVGPTQLEVSSTEDVTWLPKPPVVVQGRLVVSAMVTETGSVVYTFDMVIAGLQAFVPVGSGRTSDGRLTGAWSGVLPGGAATVLSIVAVLAPVGAFNPPTEGIVTFDRAVAAVDGANSDLITIGGLDITWLGGGVDAVQHCNTLEVNPGDAWACAGGVDSSLMGQALNATSGIVG